MTTRKYKNPPLVEALCEFVFVETPADFQAFENSFRAKIDPSFSERIEKMNITIDVFPDKTAPIQQNVGLIQYKNPKTNSLIQIGKNLLAINQLTPYTSWEDFVPLVKSNLDAYLSITGAYKLNRIKIRYINKILLPDEDMNIADFFKYSMIVPKEIASTIANFKVHTEHLFNNNRDLLSVNLHNAPPSEENFVPFVLDLSYTLIDINEVNEVNVEEWLNDAHSILNTTFEAILTERCKEYFD